MDKQTILPGLQSELEPGEDVFILRGRDPVAPWHIEMWAAFRRGDLPGALGAFYGMVDTCSERFANHSENNIEKANSAEDKAIEIRNWRIEKGLK